MRGERPTGLRCVGVDWRGKAGVDGERVNVGRDVVDLRVAVADEEDSQRLVGPDCAGENAAPSSARQMTNSRIDVYMSRGREIGQNNRTEPQVNADGRGSFRIDDIEALCIFSALICGIEEGESKRSESGLHAV